MTGSDATTAGWTAMMDRDPMLAHAVVAHGGAWRPDLEPTTTFAMDDVRGLPEVEIRTTQHRLAWRTSHGLFRRNQDWIDNHYHSHKGWHATATAPDAWPQTVLTALAGLLLTAMVDLPGAEAWIIVSATRVPGIQVDVALERNRP